MVNPESMMIFVISSDSRQCLPPAIEERDEREEADADDRVERHEPRGGQLVAHEDEVELPIAPDEVGVENLMSCKPALARCVSPQCARR